MAVDIVAKIHKTMLPQTQTEKDTICNLMVDTMQSLFMASMAIHCRKVHFSRYVKCCQGAGSLAYDYTRSVYVIRVYSVSRKTLIWEEDLNFNQSIGLQKFDPYFLSIAGVYDQTFMLEFVRTSDMYMLYTILNNLGTKHYAKTSIAKTFRRSVSETFVDATKQQYKTEVDTVDGNIGVHIVRRKAKVWQSSESRPNMSIVQSTIGKMLMDSDMQILMRPGASLRRRNAQLFNVNRHTCLDDDKTNILNSESGQLEQLMSELIDKIY